MSFSFNSNPNLYTPPQQQVKPPPAPEKKSPADEKKEPEKAKRENGSVTFERSGGELKTASRNIKASQKSSIKAASKTAPKKKAPSGEKFNSYEVTGYQWDDSFFGRIGKFLFGDMETTRATELQVIDGKVNTYYNDGQGEYSSPFFAWLGNLFRSNPSY